MDTKKTGAYLAALRKARGMTQQEAADQLGVSNKTVSKWENGAGLPDITVLPALAELYGVTADDILAGETLRQELSRKSAARERAVLSSPAGAGETVLPPASYRRSAGEESGSAGRTGVTWIGGDGETEPAGALPEFRRPGEAGSGAGAKALSRAFQRDARRYDGGFQLYD